MKTPRPYQEAAIKSVFSWFETGKTGNPLVVVPVGGGKSLIMAELIKRIHADAPNAKIISLAHIKELLEQNREALLEQYPDVNCSFYCAGLGEKNHGADVVFASIQSIHKIAREIQRAPDVLILDEAHLTPFDETTQYRRFIADCRDINPNCVVIGLTGTPFRADNGLLTVGANRMFDGICYEIGIGWMIANGYLVRPVTPATSIKMKTDGVHMRGGDYIVSELAEAVDVDEVTKECVADIVRNGVGRKKWLGFGVTIQHCYHIKEALVAHGVSCEVIHGELPKGERDQLFDDYRAGKFRCLVNVAIATTGVNIPDIDLIFLMRPMRSPVLYIQCVGRGLRLADGKEDLMLLDYGDVVSELGPIDDVKIKLSGKAKKDAEEEEKKPKEKAVMKICPQCGIECWASQQYCYECSYSFVGEKLVSSASSAPVLSEDVEPVWHNVIDAKYTSHTGQGKTVPVMRVTYYCMTGVFSEYVCFEHEGYAREKAVAWWRKRFPDDNAAHINKVSTAVICSYPQPSRILVGRDGKYDRVISVEFAKKEENEQLDIILDDFLPF